MKVWQGEPQRGCIRITADEVRGCGLYDECHDLEPQRGCIRITADEVRGYSEHDTRCADRYSTSYQLSVLYLSAQRTPLCRLSTDFVRGYSYVVPIGTSDALDITRRYAVIVCKTAKRHNKNAPNATTKLRQMP